MTVSVSTTDLPEHVFERARLFDVDALAAIYDGYESKIYSYVYHRVGNESLAQDITAQVFLRMLEAIQNDRAWQSSFSGWLYRIAHNLVVDHYRRRGRTTQVSVEDIEVLIAHGDDPLREAERRVAVDGLRSAINRLTDDQAQIITLRFLEDLSIAEVAAITGKTEGAVKALQYRAVMSLRRLMEHQA